MTNTGKGFFSIGRSEWHRVCKLGLNEACVYMIQACGTGQTNLNTAWSVNACCTYTGISRGRAKKAQTNILNPELELMTKTKEGKHPRFLFIRDEDSERVWLPKTIVTGAENESPPLERLRQTADSDLLKLFVDLYAVTNIADEGGVPREVISHQYKKERIASYAEFEIYGFQADSEYCYPNHEVIQAHIDRSAGKEKRSKHFFSLTSTLQDLGLFNYIPTVFESKDGEVLFPLIDPFSGEAVDLISESILAVLPDNYESVACNFDHVIAVPKHFKNVELTGVLFPRYRQQTELTAAGYAKTKERVETWSQIFNNLECAISRVYQGNIKGISRDDQGLHQGEFNERRN